MFNHLVTPSGTKIAHDVGDLAGYADVGEAKLALVVRALGDHRILRPVDGRWEIFHDVLADAVLAWRARHEADRALEREREEARRRHRRLLASLVGALVALAAMVAVTIYALAQRSNAREQASIARLEARAAQANALSAEAGILVPVTPPETDPELGLLLAAEAAKRLPTHRAADTLRRALLVSHIREVLPERHVVSASFSPDGERVLVATRGGAVRVYSKDARVRLGGLPDRSASDRCVVQPGRHPDPHHPSRGARDDLGRRGRADLVVRSSAHVRLFWSRRIARTDGGGRQGSGLEGERVARRDAACA